MVRKGRNVWPTHRRVSPENIKRVHELCLRNSQKGKSNEKPGVSCPTIRRYAKKARGIIRRSHPIGIRSSRYFGITLNRKTTSGWHKFL